MKNGYFKKSAAILFAWLILTAAILAIVSERSASKNPLVNVSKRAMAEAGAIVSKAFLKDRSVNNFPFGPKDGTTKGLAAVDVADYIERMPAKSGVRFLEIKNHSILRHSGDFGYEDLRAPQLRTLSDKYGLDELTSGAATEMEKIVILRNWVRKTIPRGAPEKVDYNFNALEVLAEVKNGKTYFCSEYATVFVQCALSLGINGRYVGLFKGHVVAEVWSDDFAKWIVMDVDNDIHYEKDGVPLNALELHYIWEGKDFSGLDAMKGPARMRLGLSEKERLLSYYHEFYVRMRNDWFSHRYPHWHHRANSIMDGLEWQDRFTKNNILVSRGTSDPEELYFPINIVSIKVDPENSSAGKIGLVLDTFTPGFSHFLVQANTGDPVRTEEPTYVWKLHRGANTIKVRAVNTLGVTGPESYIKILSEG